MTESPMRIALLCESFGALGGVAQIVEELAAEFALAGHRVAIVSNPAGGTLLARSVNQQIEQVLLDLPRAKPASWRHPERWFARSRANELLDFIRRWRPVLLNIHGGLRDRFPAVLEVCYEAEIPLVQSIHLVPETVAHYALTALHEARAITFPSDSVMNAFERLSPDAKRGQVIRGGANLELALKAPAYRRDRPYIFCASRLELRHKAVDALISAFAEVAADFPDTDLLIAGDGPDREKLEVQIAHAGLAHRIQLLGAQPHAEMWSLYKGALIFAMLSRMAEGLPLVFFEAMACGTPVIGTRCGGTPEVVIDRQSGLLVEKNEPREVAEVLRMMLSDPGLRLRLAWSGQELVAAHYSWRHAAAQFAELYRKCIE